MKAIGTLIQALLMAGAVTYFLPYLVAGVKELMNDLREGETKR